MLLLYLPADRALFNTELTYLVYTEARMMSPLGTVFTTIRTEIGDRIAYAQLHISFVPNPRDSQ